MVVHVEIAKYELCEPFQGFGLPCCLVETEYAEHGPFICDEADDEELGVERNLSVANLVWCKFGEFALFAGISYGLAVSAVLWVNRDFLVVQGDQENVLLAYAYETLDWGHWVRELDWRVESITFDFIAFKVPRHDETDWCAEVSLSGVVIERAGNDFTESIVERVFRLEVKTVLKNIEEFLCYHNEHKYATFWVRTILIDKDRNNFIIL